MLVKVVDFFFYFANTAIMVKALV